jgi:hypothetical protein
MTAGALNPNCALKNAGGTVLAVRIVVVPGSGQVLALSFQ